MKKIIVLAAATALALALVGCGSSQPEEPADLTGTWKSQEKGGSYQEATITEDAITINWVSDGGKTKSLYWAGTYTAPTESGDYEWTSENDISKTQSALLASSDETKDFAYKDGKISYEVSAMGTTTTMELEKADE